MSVNFPYGYNPLARLTAFRESSVLNINDYATFTGLQEFPDNTRMANHASWEILDRLNIGLVMPADEKAILASVRLSRRLHAGSNGILLCEQGKVARLNRMISAETNLFLQELDLLLTYKPINLLMSDELFKDMLYQRYQLLEWNSAARDLDSKKVRCDREGIYKILELPKEDVISIFQKGETTLANKVAWLAEGNKGIPSSNEGIPRRDSYPKYWEGNSNINTKDNDICNCAHGGGFRHLQNILSGAHPGSKLEHQDARGIQVHPHSYPEDRLNYYSRKAEVYFDSRAIITFNVEAQYLDGQPNGYEAGIRSEFLEHATDFRLENLVTGEVLQGTTLEDIREAIAKSKIGIGNF